MDMQTAYNTFIIANQSIFAQAIMVGMLIVGVSCISGFGLYAVIAIFKMLSNDR